MRKRSRSEHLDTNYSKVLLFLRTHLMSAEANNYKGMGEYRTKVSCIKVILISSIKKINSDLKLLRKQHR